jgi:hypothetical protein
MVTYWVKAKSLFLLQGSTDAKVGENLVGFESEPLLPLHLKFSG